mmetsp:Transcript_18705/g.61688  ORF Transcript_18705/g.61688 Transcript_18705/m.61688 type:complete len:210 (-) Transcript_18705:19-648(-)
MGAGRSSGRTSTRTRTCSRCSRTWRSTRPPRTLTASGRASSSRTARRSSRTLAPKPLRGARTWRSCSRTARTRLQPTTSRPTTGWTSRRWRRGASTRSTTPTTRTTRTRTRTRRRRARRPRTRRSWRSCGRGPERTRYRLGRGCASMGRVAALVRGSHAGGSMRGGGESAPQGAATLPEGVRMWTDPGIAQTSKERKKENGQPKGGMGV